MSLLKKIYNYKSSVTESIYDYNINSLAKGDVENPPVKCEKKYTFSHPLDTINVVKNKPLRTEPTNTLYGLNTSRYIIGSNKTVKSQHQRMLYPNLSYSPVRENIWEKSIVKPINPFDYTNELTVGQINNKYIIKPRVNGYFGNVGYYYPSNYQNNNVNVNLNNLATNDK